MLYLCKDEMSSCICNNTAVLPFAVLSAVIQSQEVALLELCRILVH